MSDDRVILITGTRKGIGRFLAERYLSAGRRVVGCSRSACDIEHDRYRHFELDVADESAVGRLFSTVRKELGGLDVLINNAGITADNLLITMKQN